MDEAHGNLPGAPGKGSACICGQTEDKPCDSSKVELKYLLDLYNQIADVMHERGAWCLAEKFKTLATTWEQKVQAGCTTGDNASHGNKPQCYIFPLTEALSTTKYYDYALNCVQVASTIDTTRELVYLQAFLYLALGETEQACRLYQHAAQNWGTISTDELEQIRLLVHQHIDEEDISEVYEELARSCA